MVKGLYQGQQHLLSNWGFCGSSHSYQPCVNPLSLLHLCSALQRQPLLLRLMSLGQEQLQQAAGEAGEGEEIFLQNDRVCIGRRVLPAMLS